MADTEHLLRLFADCSIAWGYCHSSGKSELAEPFRLDLERLHDRITKEVPDWKARFTGLMTDHTNPWVKVCVATILLKVTPEHASSVLEKLASEDGMWAMTSQVALGSWRQRH
jgi:hypothetical protein